MAVFGALKGRELAMSAIVHKVGFGRRPLRVWLTGSHTRAAVLARGVVLYASAMLPPASFRGKVASYGGRKRARPGLKSSCEVSDTGDGSVRRMCRGGHSYPDLERGSHAGRTMTMRV